MPSLNRPRPRLVLMVSLLLLAFTGAALAGPAAEPGGVVTTGPGAAGDSFGGGTDQPTPLPAPIWYYLQLCVGWVSSLFGG